MFWMWDIWFRKFDSGGDFTITRFSVEIFDIFYFVFFYF